MNPLRLAYHDPQTVDEAVGLLARLDVRTLLARLDVRTLLAGWR